MLLCFFSLSYSPLAVHLSCAIPCFMTRLIFGTVTGFLSESCKHILKISLSNCLVPVSFFPPEMLVVEPELKYFLQVS